MPNIVMIAGHSKLPQGMAAQSVYQTLTVTLEVETTYGVILDASCTLATEHARNYFGELLKGHSMADGLEPMIQKIEKGYHGKAQQALHAAVKDAYKQYMLMGEEKA